MPATILTIGYQKFSIDSPTKAAKIIELLQESQSVDDFYLDGTTYYIDIKPARLATETISFSNIMSRSKFDDLKLVKQKEQEEQELLNQSLVENEVSK